MALSLGSAQQPGGGAAPPPAIIAASAADGERLVRRVVIADNSCLFVAVAHALSGFVGRRERADGLRRVVADAILADGERYSEAVLGKAPHDYVEWILRSEQDSKNGE